MGFDKELYSVATGDGQHVDTQEPIIYTAKDGEVITIPTGTHSDGASTPGIIWNALPPFGLYWRAALLHDYMYQFGLYVRSKCDRIFLEAMLSGKCNWIKAHVIYLGVRIGGWKAYGDYRKKEKQK
jgi:hypothetical protein